MVYYLRICFLFCFGKDIVMGKAYPFLNIMPEYRQYLITDMIMDIVTLS